MYLPVKSNSNDEATVGSTTSNSTQTPSDLSPCTIGEGEVLSQGKNW